MLDLLTNATVVDDAIRFVSQKSRENLKSSANDNEHDKESNEPDYDQDKDQLEEEKNRRRKCNHKPNVLNKTTTTYGMKEEGTSTHR